MSISARPVYANVAFLRIPRFDAHAVAEQAALKERLEARTREAIARVPLAERVVLDAGDGLALVFFGDPAHALDVTQQVQRAAREEAPQAGLNFGPLALTARGADAAVFGDGLAAAATAAGFAHAGALLVTQDFRRALEASAPERAASLAAAGEFTDSRVRLHSFYAPDANVASRRRRMLLGYAVGGSVAIVLLGVVARQARRLLFPPAPATIAFVVRPRGEIFIDGVPKGFAPPLQEISIAPGRRVIEIRNAGFAPLEVTLDLEPGERRTLAHTFATRRAAQGKPQQSDWWRDLRRKFGGS